MLNSFKQTKICIYLLIAITALQMLSLLNIYNFKNIIAFLGFWMLFLAYNIMSASFKKMAGIFFILGACLNIYNQQPLQSWIDGINYMLNIAAILVIMQLFTIPIKLDDYNNCLKYLILRTFKNERVVYIFTLVVVHMFSSFLLFGTIPVMVSLLGEPLKKVVKNYQQFLSTALTRSYSMAVMWAPGAVNVVLIVNATGAKWVDMFFLGIALTLWGLFLAYISQLKYLSSSPLEKTDEQVQDMPDLSKKAYKKLLFILFVVIVLILLILFFEKLAIGDNTSRVMLASLILSVAWICMFLKHKELKNAVNDYLNENLVKTVDLTGLYVCLGIFSKAIETSGILVFFYPFLNNIGESTGIFMIPILSFLVFILSLIGLHPFIIMVVLGKMATSIALPFSPEIIAMSILLGASVAYMSSPFVGIVLTASKYLDVTSYTVGFKWNGFFACCYFVTGVVIIMLWHMLYT